MKKIIAFIFLTALPALASPNLVGVWKTSCTRFTQHSYKATATFSNDKMIFIIRFFSDRGCVVNSITITYEGAYSIGQEFGGNTEINHVPSSVKYTLQLQDVVDRYNTLPTDGCGITDWHLDVPQEVSGHFCRPSYIPAPGQTIYDVFNIKGGTLRFGGMPEHFDMVSPDLRPRMLSLIRFNQIDLESVLGKFK